MTTFPQSPNGPLRVGIGGPVGAGKTTLTAKLCAALAKRCSMAVVTNDIYTREDADFLVRNQALAPLVSGIDVYVAGGGHELAVGHEAVGEFHELVDRLGQARLESVHPAHVAAHLPCPALGINRPQRVASGPG